MVINISIKVRKVREREYLILIINQACFKDKPSIVHRNILSSRVLNLKYTYFHTKYLLLLNFNF